MAIIFNSAHVALFITILQKLATVLGIQWSPLNLVLPLFSSALADFLQAKLTLHLALVENVLQSA